MIDETVNEKITNFKNLCSSICGDQQLKILIGLMDNETIYNLFEGMYLNSSITQTDAYHELVDKLKLTPNEDEKCKIERYIEYFFEILRVKIETTSYEDLLKKL